MANGYEDDITVDTGAKADEVPAEKTVGVFQRADDELVAQLRRWLLEASTADSDRRKDRETEWAALAGDQWEQADIDRMQHAKRARLTLNLLQTTIAAVEGEERTNRQEIKFYGEEKGDDGAAAGMNKLLKWVMNQCGGEFALSGLFKGGVAVGEGWVNPEVDYFDDPEGMVKLCLVDEAEMFVDPLSVDPVARDARFMQRGRMKEEDEIEARWPGKVQELTARVQAGPDGMETDGKGFRDVYLAPGDAKSPKVYDSKTKQWFVVEAWWSQIEPGMVVVDEKTDQLQELSLDEFEKAKEGREAERQAFVQAAMTGALQPEPSPLPGLPGPMPQMPPPLQAKDRPIRRLYQAFYCGEVLLEKRPCEVRNLRRFPYVPFRSLFDKKNKSWHGLLKMLLDLQRQHNVEQSAIIQLIQQMPHASWMAPKGAFHNKAEWEQKAAQTGKMLEYNAQRGKPEQIATPAIPRHLIELAMSRPQSMRDVSGVNTELTGQRGNADAGVVMEMRKKAATTVLAPIFDNYRMAKMEIGKVLLSYIQTFVPTQRKVRVLGDDCAEYVPMTEEMSLGRFDLKVEETNASVNDRIATLTVLQTTLPQMLKAGVPIPAEFADLLPIEPKIRDVMKRMIAWQLLKSGMAPPPGWQPGMPDPTLLPPPGVVPTPVDPASPPVGQ